MEADILYQGLEVEAVLKGSGDVEGEGYRGGRLEGSVWRRLRKSAATEYVCQRVLGTPKTKPSVLIYTIG